MSPRPLDLTPHPSCSCTANRTRRLATGTRGSHRSLAATHRPSAVHRSPTLPLNTPTLVPS